MTFPFVNAALLGGLGLVAVPVLIHLINMLRHKRVEWAAMEFLLQSQKKNRTWVRFKELLLLLLRMLAVAAVVMILAQPLADASALLQMFGERTQHIVLLDDSFSMSDRWSGSTAFDRAKQAIVRIGQQAAEESVAQGFTLRRFSQAGLGATGGADLLDVKVTVDFGERLDAQIKPWQPTDLAVEPGAVLDDVLNSLTTDTGSQRIIYLVSDFRAKEWESPAALAEKLTRLQALPAKLKFVQCADVARANAAIASLDPAGGIVAAGVPFSMQVTVANHGSAPLKDLSVTLEEDGVGRPALTFDLIAAGETESRLFPVNFATAGDHVVTARIASDAVTADNVRQRIVRVPLGNPVLLVDGNDKAPDAQFLRNVFEPGGRVKTGIEPVVERPTWLNNNSLDRFGSIYLANLDRLDPPAIASLEKFITAGGGVAFFLGDTCRADFFNAQLYRDGQGPFPLPLQAPTQLLVDRLDKGSDIQIVSPNHPMFKVFAGERNTFLSAVTIDRFFASPRNWTPPSDSTTEIIARLRNGSPLAVEKRFGQGRVVAITTTAAPTWNNWGPNPSFVVAMLELQSHLIADRARGVDRLAGSGLEQLLEVDKYQRRARFVPPAGSGLEPVSADLNDSPQGIRAAFPTTSAAGVYELQLTTTDNQAESRRFALNVDPRESDLTLLDAEQLSSRLPGVKFETLRVDQIVLAANSAERANISDLLLYGLVALLLGEQALAYSASYHPKAVVGRAA
jgi:hypothetical protein